MADRASGEGKPGVPKEVFELDKDERWQARLDEARARREIALRERAAGKPQKPRPKPWELDGAAVEKPPEINPVVQERGDDKFDFADRLETIRDAQADKTPVPPGPPRVAPAPDPEPEFEPERPPAAKKPGPEPRARPQPSLILPGAPDVADLAARYAATLDTPEPLTSREPTPPLEPRAPKKQTAELVALPTAAPPKPAPEPARPLTRAERRRGIRPLGMAVGLLTFAALPLTTEAPPLQFGPEMPVIDLFRIQPALGVTWSLAERPFETSALTWQPPNAPRSLNAVPFAPPVSVQSGIASLAPTAPTVDSGVAWTGLNAVVPGVPAPLTVPDASVEPTPVITEGPRPPVLLPDTGESPATTVPVETVAPTPGLTAPVLPEGAIGAPPRPTTLQDQATPPPPPPTPPAARPTPSDTVVEADPLRVTILAPARVARALSDDIASDIQRDGHELVRVKDINFNISTRNVRYFHDADRAAAARMAERYDAELRDFTWFRPRPVEGTAELWLAGRAPGGNTSGRTQPGGASGPGEVLERVFDRLGLGTELPDALPGADALRRVLPRN